MNEQKLNDFVSVNKREMNQYPVSYDEANEFGDEVCCYEICVPSCSGLIQVGLIREVVSGSVSVCLHGVGRFDQFLCLADALDFIRRFGKNSGRLELCNCVLERVKQITG